MCYQNVKLETNDEINTKLQLLANKGEINRQNEIACFGTYISSYKKYAKYRLKYIEVEQKMTNNFALNVDEII